MAEYKMTLIGPWGEARGEQPGVIRLNVAQVALDYPIERYENATLPAKIVPPPDPNTFVCTVWCDGAVAAQIEADETYTVLAAEEAG